MLWMSEVNGWWVSYVTHVLASYPSTTIIRHILLLKNKINKKLTLGNNHDGLMIDFGLGT